MLATRSLICVATFAAVVMASAWGAELAWIPVEADGPHTIDGNGIILLEGGQLVTLELSVSGWDSDEGLLLGVYQATVDSDGYGSGWGDLLIPLGWPGSPEDGAFIDVNRPDFAFAGLVPIAALATCILDYQWGSTSFSDGKPDDGQAYYGGTLILEVPAGAAGTYVIGFVDDPLKTFMYDGEGCNISPIITVPALIMIACQTDDQCDDGNACTTDVCEPGNVCANDPNYDEMLHCCSPASGTLTSLDDGNECTVGICNPMDGTVAQQPVLAGALCGDPPNGVCDAQDTCDGSGTCVDRYADTGTSCGDPPDGVCNAQNTCDGSGTCVDHYADTGTPCVVDAGDPECTEPGNCSCDGVGVCQPNDEPPADPTPLPGGFIIIPGGVILGPGGIVISPGGQILEPGGIVISPGGGDQQVAY